MVSDKEIEAAARAVATADWRFEIDEFREPKRWTEAVDAYNLTNNNWRFRYDEIARAALSAAARVREEDNDKPVAWRYRYTDPVSGKPVWRYDNRLWNGQRPSERQALYARPAPQPSEPVEALISAVGKYALEKGEGWRIGEGAEIMDAYQAALTTSKPEQSGWQPIETAPADGRMILVYEARSAHPIHLRSADGDWWRKQGVGPSHWMPLPTPPTAGGGDA